MDWLGGRRRLVGWGVEAIEDGGTVEGSADEVVAAAVVVEGLLELRVGETATGTLLLGMRGGGGDGRDLVVKGGRRGRGKLGRAEQGRRVRSLEGRRVSGGRVVRRGRVVSSGVRSAGRAPQTLRAAFAVERSGVEAEATIEAGRRAGRMVGWFLCQSSTLGIAVEARVLAVHGPSDGRGEGRKGTWGCAC